MDQSYVSSLGRMGEGKEKQLREDAAAERTSSSGDRVLIWLVPLLSGPGSLTGFVSNTISNGGSVHTRLSR